MNRKNYIKIIMAIIKLLVTVMVEAGRVPIDSATKVGDNVLKAITGLRHDAAEKITEK
jgi:hypothetical protein